MLALGFIYGSNFPDNMKIRKKKTKSRFEQGDISSVCLQYYSMEDVLSTYLAI